jgi:putative toxin-antitoxin system antitoxin component (TIGR02293 family)
MAAGDNEGFDLDTAIFAKAVEIFGSTEEAELWLCRPEMGLNGEPPVDLLRSPEGKLLVKEWLGRLECTLDVMSRQRSRR